MLEFLEFLDFFAKKSAVAISRDPVSSLPGAQYTSVPRSHNATKPSRHAATFLCSRVDLTDVSSRKSSCKRSRTDRKAEASKARLAPGGLSGGRFGRQEARLEVVLGARGRQARPEAVWAARRPECRVLCSFATPMLVLLQGFA